MNVWSYLVPVKRALKLIIFQYLYQARDKEFFLAGSVLNSFLQLQTSNTEKNVLCYHDFE